MSDPQTFRALCDSTPAIGPGARYIAVDFHFHTPASGADYKERRPGTYDAIAATLAAKKVDAVFVTDHNTWEGIAPLRDAARRAGLALRIYPGAELSIPAPAISSEDARGDRKIDTAFFHCLVLLPPTDDAEDRLASLITHNHTDASILSLAPVDRRLKQPLEEIAAIVRGWGGLLLPAHLHQGKPLEKSRSYDDIYADKLAIEYLQYFDAIELRKVTSAVFFDGAHLGDNNVLIPERACVLGSDAHCLADIGREATYLLAESPSFDDIKTSLAFRERVQFAKPAVPASFLREMVVEGLFLGTCHLIFNPFLNSFIGTKGSGKTARISSPRRSTLS
jgi:PHP family Zn ribbon phosphoesterase